MRAHSDQSNTQRRTKRTRGSDLSEVFPHVAVAAQTRRNDHNQKLTSVDLRALSTSITTTISQAIQRALGTGGTHSTDPQDPRAPSILPVESDGERSSSGAIQGEIAAITQGTQPQSSPREPFSSIAIALGSRVNPKIKAKIWGNKYVDFGGLLSLSPNIDRYSLSLTPSSTSSNQPQLTLQPSQPPKRIHNLNQWLSASNTFVAIYKEKYPLEAPKLMKYCEVVRDIASKPGDWSFYDEQFRFVRQSAPEQYPWDTIHWELWLRAVTTFRARPQVSSNKASTCSRNRRSFPKGTCWAFHAGIFCGGCCLDHVCFKCGLPHPSSQCSTPSSQRAPLAHPGAKRAHPPAQQSGHPRKGGQA
ncbi:uncharacterized protein LOC111346446 [Stylophora pistillata]|uniref:uncharacterized protein LOC111346446 n=1 Tax=Stylophora pistillata TaxID=50429 RepID=UPI000C04DA23|nr:uncharacterized protein LOC111346446 [Stylophora pistillata]